MGFSILAGDVMAGLGSLPAGSARCCVTSPPYWGLRDYGHAGQIGLERTPDEYVARMVEVFSEVRRVLADDGTLWLNLGDSYAGGGGYAPDAPCNQARANGERWGALHPARSETMAAKEKPAHARKAPAGLKPKDLVGIPWRVAFALQADGWWLRSDIIWHKPNPMPKSVTDRPTKAHEYLFLLTKSERYHYNAAAVAEASLEFERTPDRPRVDPEQRKGAQDPRIDGVSHCGVGATRNRRSVWSITTEPYAGAHFAVMPTRLVEPCILAGSAPGDTVLDPFTGSGTVGVVALRHGRHFVGCELNPEYVRLAQERIRGDAPLFNSVVAV